MFMKTQRSANRRALLLIDFQRDFVEPTGRMPAAQNQIPAVLAGASRAVIDARSNGDLVVTVGNEFRPRDYFMNLLRRRAAVAGSEGARWTERLNVEGAVYFAKWAGSAFVNPDLEIWLREHEVTTLTLCGLMARACVTATAKDALSKGYKVRILSAAVACYSDLSRERALARLRKQGVDIIPNAV